MHINLQKIIFICFALGCINTAVASYSHSEKPKRSLLQNILEKSWNQSASLKASAGEITITGAGNIHFLQAFYYSDAACSNILGVASIIDNGRGFPFSNGQTVRFTSRAAYKLANDQHITTNDIACIKLYLDGGNQASNGASCQAFTDVSCSGTTCTSQQTKTVNWVSNPIACATRYIYVANKKGNTVSKCDISNEDGALGNCNSTGSEFNQPAGISINNCYASTANQKNNTVIKCMVNPNDGGFSECAETGENFNRPFATLYNDSYVYITNYRASTVSKCKVVTTDGTFSDCITTGSGFKRPTGIRINNRYAYVANYTRNTISKCLIDTATGEFSDCAITGSGFNRPAGIAVNNGYAYIGNSRSDLVLKCTVNPINGELSECASTGSGFNDPVGINIKNGYAYIGNQRNNNVLKCLVDASTGAFSDCNETGSGFKQTREIYIY